MIRVRPNLAQLSGWLWLIFCISASAAKDSTRANLEFFEKRIRPVLAERCYQCHSQQSEKIRGGLLLDSKAGLEKGGESGAVVVPGEPEKSRLIQAIRYSEKDLQMPPKQMLSSDQIADFERWVKMGAPDSRTSIATRTISTNHWAFKPLRSQKTPKTANSRWPQSPIDFFVLARLEAEKLQPAHAAQKRVLIRRATFDLTGLPPTPKQVEQFVDDSTPEAFSKVVDRLLATPQFGETWGRHWLDVARYADSNGLEINTPFENAWRYRDYVVRSFNQDKPFNEFVREQIAGDLIDAVNDDDRYEKITATGFMALGPKVLGESDREKLIMDVVDEQIDVTTRAFLGLTVSCARCHDHKFDPIPTRDYYALAGIFKSTVTLNEASQQRPSTPWLERPLAPPEIAARVDAYNIALSDLQTKLTAARQRKAALPGGIDSSKQEGILVDNLAAEVIGAWKESNYATNFVDKNYLHDGNEGKGKKLVRFRPAIPRKGLYEVRIAYIPRENRATNVPITITAADQQKTVYLNERNQPSVNKIFASIGSFRFDKGTNGTITISNEGTKGFVAVDAVHLVEVTDDPTMKVMTSNAMKESTNAMLNEEPPSDVEVEAKLDDLAAKAPSPVPLAMAVKDGPAQNCRINLRGDSKKLGEEVPRGFIKVVDSPAQILPADQSGRLQLADWIANAQNPLTARVMVNRIWSHLFGRGIVNTPDNFGALG
ncbi:MAG: xly 1, partial [Verrucomicrobiales bacterium]|nr:xly 1 [Verrucomicrobiales bacterium]